MTMSEDECFEYDYYTKIYNSSQKWNVKGWNNAGIYRSSWTFYSPQNKWSTKQIWNKKEEQYFNWMKTNWWFLGFIVLVLIIVEILLALNLL